MKKAEKYFKDRKTMEEFLQSNHLHDMANTPVG